MNMNYSSTAPDDPATSRLLDLLNSNKSGLDPSSRALLTHAVDLLCTHLARGHAAPVGMTPLTSPRRGLADWQIRRVTAYMREHLDRQISLREMADLLKLSRHHFCTAFRMATGYTPFEWLTHQRVALAKEMLASLHLSVTEIALSVGYENPSAFTASFRRTTGMTPSDYRRQLPGSAIATGSPAPS